MLFSFYYRDFITFSCFYVAPFVAATSPPLPHFFQYPRAALVIPAIFFFFRFFRYAFSALLFFSLLVFLFFFFSILSSSLFYYRYFRFSYLALLLLSPDLPFSISLAYFVPGNFMLQFTFTTCSLFSFARVKLRLE